MRKNKKNLRQTEYRNIKKTIRKFNREHNLEKLCLSPKLLKKFRKCEKYILVLFFLVIGFILMSFLIDYLDDGKVSLLPLH